MVVTVHAFDPIPADLWDLRQRLSNAAAEGPAEASEVIAGLLARYGPAVVRVVDLLLVGLGIRGGIDGLTEARGDPF